MPKILIADDSTFMRSQLKEILAKAGYNDTDEAADGKETLEQYRKAKAARDKEQAIAGGH